MVKLIFNKVGSFRRLAGLVAFSFFAASACNSATPEKQKMVSNDTLVSLSQGDLIGYRHENGAKVWRNIPYAMPPVGELRWKAPRNPSDWEGVRHSLENPQWCTQLTGPLDKLYGIEEDQILGSEDCLYLNIYSPSKAVPGKKYPVMFWIHGGSNTWGRAEEYDGAKLAEDQGVVVIVIQYRLGPMGWFSYPALQDTSDNALDNAASFALLDLIAGLKWVKGNISKFGGDPDNVSIFGESAGAHNVLGLIISPLSKGLFHKAIAQSALPYSIDLDIARSGDDRVTNGSEAIVANLFESKRPDRSDLIRLSAEEIWRQYQDENNRANMPTMIADDVVLPRGEMQHQLIDALEERDMPFLFGSTRDEAKFVFAFHKDYTTKQFGIFPKAKDKQFYAALNDHINHMWRALGVDGVAEIIKKRSLENSYAYRFDWDEEGTYFLSDFSFLLGAAHSLDVPFVFGNFDGFLGRVSKIAFRKKSADVRNDLSARMMSYWAEFAYSGAPGRGRDGTLLEWPSLTDEGQYRSLILDTQNDGGVRVLNENQTIKGVLEEVRSDKRLSKDGDRCKVAIELNRYFGRADAFIERFATQLCDGGS